MRCPHCRERTTEVFNSRSTKFGSQVWRRRRCLECKVAFTTYEAPDLGFIQVAKVSGKPQAYSRAKLFSSIYHAFTEVKAKPAIIDAVTDTVEAKILDLRRTLLPSSSIADIVLETLKHYSTAAFVRYLSGQTELANEAALRRQMKKY